MPPLIPEQLHVQGPVPAKGEMLPCKQRFAVGAVANDPPLAVPQTPATGPEIVDTVILLVTFDANKFAVSAASTRTL